MCEISSRYCRAKKREGRKLVAPVAFSEGNGETNSSPEAGKERSTDDGAHAPHFRQPPSPVFRLFRLITPTPQTRPTHFAPHQRSTVPPSETLITMATAIPAALTSWLKQTYPKPRVDQVYANRSDSGTFGEVNCGRL